MATLRLHGELDNVQAFDAFDLTCSVGIFMIGIFMKSHNNTLPHGSGEFATPSPVIRDVMT